MTMSKKINQFKSRIIKSNKKRSKNMKIMIQFLTMLGQVGKVTLVVRENRKGK